MNKRIEFVPSGRGKAQCPPNPEYPNGMDVNGAGASELFCKVELPYPAPECGHWLVDCVDCNFRLVVTAAGRVDDPKSVTMPCGIAASPQTH